MASFWGNYWRMGEIFWYQYKATGEWGQAEPAGVSPQTIVALQLQWSTFYDYKQLGLKCYWFLIPER